MVERSRSPVRRPPTSKSPVKVASLNRRPLDTRSRTWAIAAAQLLTRLNVPPNVISIASIFFAFFAAYSFYSVPIETSHTCKLLWLALGVPVGVLGRLLCNMLDGMVAVEGGKRSKSGELYNDIPDRFSDAVIFVGFGYALPTFPYSTSLGWIAALAAVLTAYIRVLGASLRTHHHFEGPFAKQHRMFFTWTSSIVAAAELHWRGSIYFLYYALVSIIIGTLFTCVRRLISIQKEVEALPWPSK